MRTLTAFLLVVTPLVAAQDVEPRPWPHELSDLPPQPGVERGHLANGLRYAWVHAGEGEDRARIWLHVAVGSLHEGPGEQGLAHVLEHVVHRGTANWTPERLAQWAARHGMVSGPDLNAFTSQTATIYLVDLPRPDRELVLEGLEVLRELATRPTLSAEGLAHELPIVSAEERETEGPMAAFDESLERWVRRGLRGGSSAVIGTAEVRAAFTAEQLRAFHARWYRPERMTLVLAGELPEDVPGAVAAVFGDLPAATGEPPSEASIGTFDPGLDPVVVERHPDVTGVGLYLQRARAREHRTPQRASLRRGLTGTIAASLLERRLVLLVEEHPHVLETAAVDLITPTATMPVLGLHVFVRPRDRRWRAALTLVEQELRRALEHGFDPAEARAEVEAARGFIAQAAAEETERDPAEAADWLLFEAGDDGLDHDSNAMLPEVEAWLDAVDPAAVARVLADLWGPAEQPTRLALLGDVPAGVTVQELADTLAASAAEPVAPRVYAEAPPFAHASDPEAPSEVAATSIDRGGGVHRSTLSNGVRLLHTPAEAERVEVLVHLRGGRMTLPPEDWYLARAAEEVFLELGVEGHGTAELARVVAGYDVRVGFDVEEDGLLLSGNSALDDLGMQLDLIAAFVAHPGWRAEPYDRWREAYADSFTDLMAQPGAAATYLFLPELFAPDGVGLIDPTRVAALELATLRGWLAGELAEAPVTVLVWGGEEEQVRAQFARSFGGLPDRREPRTYLECLRTSPLATGVRREYELDGAEQGLVFLALPTTDGRVPSRAWALSLLADVLSTRIAQRLREELGLTYGPSADSYSSRVFSSHGFLGVMVPTDAERIEEVERACLAVLAELKEDGVGRAELERIRSPRGVEHSERYWIDVLAGFRIDDDPIGNWEREGTFLASVTVARLNRYARRYLDPERASIGVFRPRR